MVKQNETAEKLLVRWLVKQNYYNRSVRKNQSAEKRKQRLSKQLQYNKSVWQNESAESREKRKSQQHVYHAARRDNTAAKTITTLRWLHTVSWKV